MISYRNRIPHERVRPLPIYRSGVGAAHGHFSRLVDQAIQILERGPKGTFAAG